jgi:N-acetyl-gamma-glutamyl-phosphate reductase
MLYKKKIKNKANKMQQKIKVGIIGGAGYTGGELLRLLLLHPNTNIAFIHSNSNAGNPVHEVHQDLIGTTDLCFSDKIETDIDVLFLCLGHGDSKKFLEENNLPLSIKIIDLANDFRLLENAQQGERNFTYGLPEMNLGAIQQASNIANPGCFATAIQLGLLPLAAIGELKEIYTTGITGSTGAGQSLSATSHFSWRANNIQAYKTLTHQHLQEIHQSLEKMQQQQKASLHFVPWRGDFTRGIFVSSSLSSKLPLEELYEIYTAYYEKSPFTIVSKKQISLKQVVNTNKCLIHLEKENDMLVVHSAIDNLLKGASGQAVENMNLLFKLERTTGLQLKPAAF